MLMVATQFKISNFSKNKSIFLNSKWSNILIRTAIDRILMNTLKEKCTKFEKKIVWIVLI